MSIVVISQNQRDALPAMAEALCYHTPIFVLDRCADNSADVLDSLHRPHLVNEHGTGHLAGRMRDLGAAHFGYKGPLLFLDGDKVPQGDLTILPTLGFDCVLMGVAGDRRGFSDGLIPWLKAGDLTNPHNGVYSCGIWLNQRAIDAARAACNGRVFDGAFDGHWGEEDRYLGDVLAKAGLTIGYTTQIVLSGGLTDPEVGAAKMHRNWMTRLRISGRIAPEIPTIAY